VAHAKQPTITIDEFKRSQSKQYAGQARHPGVDELLK
jgi:hypothetical protein